MNKYRVTLSNGGETIESVDNICVTNGSLYLYNEIKDKHLELMNRDMITIYASGTWRLVEKVDELLPSK